MTTPTPPEGRIATEQRGHLLLMQIDRPAKRNGFTPAMYRQLAEAYTRLDDDPALRVGVLHAAGEHFTAGLDLPSFAPLMQRGERAFPDGLVDPTNLGLPRYRRRTKPVVVAVQGITYTLGIELMLAADIVVAASDCRFSQLEVKRGIMATGGATLRMAERSGLGNALLHLLTGDEFDAAEALRLNYVQKVVPARALLDEALQIAEQIAAQAPLAVVATRLNMLKVLEDGPMAAMGKFEATPQRLANSEDAMEGVRSFGRERRQDLPAAKPDRVGWVERSAPWRIEPPMSKHCWVGSATQRTVFNASRRDHCPREFKAKRRGRSGAEETADHFSRNFLHLRSGRPAIDQLRYIRLQARRRSSGAALGAQHNEQIDHSRFAN